MPDAVLIADDERCYIHANPAACELLGRSLGQIVGCRIEDFAAPEFRDQIARQWQCFLDAGVQRGAFCLLRPDGSVREVEFTAVARLRPGAHISLIRDVTEQRNRERAHLALEQERWEQAQQLARVNADLQQFVYAASHDLKEPLRNMAAFSQLLAQRGRDKLDACEIEYLSYIGNGARRMAELIDGLLEYSRVSFQGGLILEQADAQAIAQQAIDNLSGSIARAGAIITVPKLPTIRCARLSLVQVFQNLIANAIKYCREETPHIDISCDSRGGDWIFQVRDNGIGIAEEHHVQIFGIFKRLHGNEYEGTGMGLAICKAIVEKHGGRLWVESALGKGSTFSFSLPQ
ncbi:MAG: PAS domain-containing protein [Acidobacteriaceae bacterium]|nr:PAS domain-containing protein [Acidobacteriaceae bacterium]